MMPLKDIDATLRADPRLKRHHPSLHDPLYWYIVLAVGSLGMAIGFWLGS